MPDLPNQSEIRAVTFDAAHTIYYPQPSVGAIYREVIQRHGLDYPQDALQDGFRRAFKTIGKDRNILDGERREWSYWVAIFRESIRECAPQPDNFETLFQDLWEEFANGHRWSPEPTARETLTALRENGYQTALLTNWDKRVRQVVEQTGFAPLFDHLFVSSEIGAEKPDTAIFTYSATQLGLQPSQILHVGDSLQHDIAGALAAGWQTVRITEDRDPAENHLSISKLSDLLPLLLP